MTIIKPSQGQTLPWVKWLMPQNQPSPLKSQFVTSPQTDSVQFTSGLKAAFEESTESPDQNAQEARNGDPQAQRLLATEAAEPKSVWG